MLDSAKQKCTSTSIAFFRRKNSEGAFVTVYWCTEENEVELRDQMSSNGFEEALIPFNLGLLRNHDFTLYVEKSGGWFSWLPGFNQRTSHLVGQLFSEDILEHGYVHIGDIPAFLVNGQTYNFAHVHLCLKSNRKGSNDVIIPCRGRLGEGQSMHSVSEQIRITALFSGLPQT